MEFATGSLHLPPGFSKRIKQLRSKSGLTQKQLAELLDVSTASVKLWEQRRSYPPVSYW